MKITCNRQQLVEAVSNVQRAVSTKSSVPALEGILLRTKENTVELCGYDLEIGMTTVIPASIEEEGSIVLSARLFADIVRRMPEDTIFIGADEKFMTTITSGASEYSIVGISAQEFPELPSINAEMPFTMSQTVLKSMIRQTIFAVADSDAKPIHTGTLFEISGGKIRLVAVDGYRLAVREEPISCDGSTNFVVPKKTLSEVLKLIKDEEGDLVLHVGRRHILFTIGSYTVISRLLEGEFLDYNAAIPKVSSMQGVVKTRAFIESVERVSLLITDRLKSPVRCVFSGSEIRISCSTSIGRANDQIAAQFEGGEVEMGFNNHYLLDALRNTEGDEVRVELNGPLSPMKILPREGDSFLFLVLPVRLKND